MTQADIAGQLAAGSLLLRRDPARTFSSIGVHLMGAVALGLPAIHDGTWWVLLRWLGSIGFGCLALIIAVQAFRGVPVLQASGAGIWLNREGGSRVFVPWRDTVGFTNYDSILAIRLREGAWPIGSVWARITGAAGWAGGTAFVPLWTTGAIPGEVANALSALRLRYLAA